ncbi:ATP-binding cassette domain-containing protein [Oscillospiraceae bacterium N12]|jgi:cell division transport system ATP-binding protein|uniref:ATP-binding cassette domain-containing protein n=1 Tax=Jilunia laotingensis TaxID=2763675 RepID=A0A926F8J2_9BACT|nr:ATP-binding cassette domain-containing protein [Jilunia laotingensis]MBC8594052.1 ATP-binding cassette domain-containing protein [Jilunia laotingensis]
MDEALIKYNKVEIHQQDLCVLSDVTLELQKGEFVYLIGKVGSGKTSLLKTFYGELDVVDGEAEVLGYNMRTIKRKYIPQLRRKLGIVFQDFQLLTDRTVYNNLEFVLRATGWKNKQEIKDRIEEVLQLVGMSNKGYKLPNELSGGEQQRIVIARAVLNSPAIILADEPTGNLDVETGRAIVELLHGICESGSSVVMTTHNLHILNQFPGRVYRCAEHHITDVTHEFSKDK